MRATWRSPKIAALGQVAQNSGMAKTAADVPTPKPDDGLIRFEQPLTERMRTFLRVEFLFRQAHFHAQNPSDYSARAAIASLLDIMTILGRGDIRTDVLKELDRHAELLGQYRRAPGIDAARLNSLLDEVGALKKRLAEVGNHFMNALKESDFLSTIKHRSTIPGGTCMFDLPDYNYWLHRPPKEREGQLEAWFAQITPVCDAVAEVLWLTREATEPVESIAYGGLYHHSLNRTEQFNLVRVLLPATTRHFPEVSAGQHRFTIRFVEWIGVEARPKQVSADVNFKLSLC